MHHIHRASGGDLTQWEKWEHSGGWPVLGLVVWGTGSTKPRQTNMHKADGGIWLTLSGKQAL